MKPKLLLLVTSDPRTSARPAEAVRIAAGIGAWKKADVTLYLLSFQVQRLVVFARRASVPAAKNRELVLSSCRR